MKDEEDSYRVDKFWYIYMNPETRRTHMAKECLKSTLKQIGNQDVNFETGIQKPPQYWQGNKYDSMLS